jgi:PKD repeat protein
MRKILPTALFLLIFLSLTQLNAQVIIGSVDAGPYGRGSSISVPFMIPSTNTCLAKDNKFEIYLSDVNGSFAAETKIGELSGFYSTYINGTIPNNALAGNNYKLRVKTTSPATVVEYSGTVQILATAGPNVGVEPQNANQVLQTDAVFGYCGNAVGDNNTMNLNTNYPALTTQRLILTNDRTGQSQSYILNDNAFKLLSLNTGYYTATVYGENIVGGVTIKSSKSYLITNILSKISAGSDGLAGCVDPATGAGADITYTVDITSSNGMQFNYPGTLYRFTWGDGTSEEISHCELINSGGFIRHNYKQTSCGQPPINLGNGGGTITNSFAITFTAINKYCTADPVSLSTFTKIFSKPIAKIDPTSSSTACVGVPVVFKNTSTAGNNANCSVTMNYRWFIDDVEVSARDVYTHTFTTPGIHIVKLIASNDVNICQPSEDIREICVQNPPQLSFNLTAAGSTICAPGILKPTNTSIIDANCNTNNVYKWTVTGAPITYANNTNENSPEPEFNFTTPGVYKVKLSITTASCGVFNTEEQTVVVNGPPVATLSADIRLCNIGVYNFNDITTGPTKTLISGSFNEPVGTYTWEVTGGDYSFDGTTNANSKYPNINFKAYATYTIKVTHTNSCATVTDTQVISFIEAPVVNAGPDVSLCFRDNATLAATITGEVVSFEWTGGTGVFSDRNSKTSTYSPSAAERAAGIATLKFHVVTDLAAPCNVIDDELQIIIKPEIKVNTPPAASLCTGGTLGLALTATPANTTFTWTATGSANARGFANGSGNVIPDVLTNTDPTNNATVTYVITPSNDGCTGDPYTITVTITPIPIITATAVNATICNGQTATINLGSNLAETRYTWTSTVTSGTVLGNSDGITPATLTAITNVLVNNGTVAGTVEYTITAVSANNCAGNTIKVVIRVEPSVTIAAAGADENICSASTYTLKGNQPVVGTGKWTLITGPTGASFEDDTKYNTLVSGLQSGQTYTFRWTINSTAGCAPSTDEVTIIVSQVSIGGTTAGTATVCSGNNSGVITLTGQTGAVINWESSIDNGATWQTLASTSATYNFSNITATTLFRAVVQNGNCPPANSSATLITVTPGTVVATAGPDQVLCNLNTTTLAGNSPGTDSGVWTVTSGQTGIIFASPTSATTTVSGLIGGQTYLFTWTITGSGACPPTSDEVRVSNLGAITNTISTSTPIVCSGQTILVSGSEPTGGDNTYTYLWERSSNSGGTWVAISGQTSKDLTYVLTDALIFRRTVSSSSCSSISNTINVVAQPPISNNVISSDQSVCIGSTPAPLTGTTPAGGDGVYNYQWQSSPDGTTWTNINGSVFSGLSIPAITTSMFYRRLVSTAACSGSLQNISNPVKITVNPNAEAVFTFTADAGCAPFVLTDQNIKATPFPDRNGTYTWFANNVQIGTGINFPGYTITGSNVAVEIKLEVTSSLGCTSAQMAHTFVTQQSVLASFTKDKAEGCGTTVINFTNTTPVLPGSTYVWNFGNGNTSNSYNPTAQTYLQEATGKDTTYTITLTVNTTCGSNTTTTSLFVKANPLAVFSPDKTSGCTPFTVTFSNTSPGSTNTYYYDFGDGTTLVKTDKTPVTHTYTTPTTRDFVVKMIAENSCGRSEPTQYTLRVSPNTIIPELVVNSTEQQGCAPLTVNFQNNSSGATSFTYDFGDGTTAGPTRSAPETVPHTFTKGGTYIVTLTATNGCSTVTTTETIVVYNQPLPQFTADVTSGCAGLGVKFTNTTTDGFSYVWDFGDGSTSTEFAPQHIYSGTQEYYTVSLTATNTSGCSNVTIKNQFIHIVPPPVSKFNVLPSIQISIPNYTFRFEDESENTPDRWEWTFGDGSTSTSKSPSHVYPDTGSNVVTLKVTNQEGCSSTSTKTVRIIGVPGYLFVPNAFMPSSATSELREFKAKGSGLASWTMSIFNKWGELLWSTDKLDEGRPVEGWDGTFRSTPVAQGVYYWKIDVQMTNGTPWKGVSLNGSSPKRTGSINLIR